MNTDDLNFAYKVRHALNDKLDDLPASTTDRLAQARKMALARKKAHVDAPLTYVLPKKNWPRPAASCRSSSAGWAAWAWPCRCCCWLAA
jgi:hypothetical protein